jgi:hypothetical protein
LVVMMMRRTTSALCFGLLLFACGCSAVSPRPKKALDCSVKDAYDFSNIFNFANGTSNWYQFADSTPGGVPDVADAGSNVLVANVEAPGDCGDPGDLGALELKAYGHNFYGTGFGDYQHNNSSSHAIGTGYDGISFWARSPGDTDKTFMLYVDDGRTIVLTPDATDGGPTLGPGDTVPGSYCQLPPPQSLGTPACYYGGALPPAMATRVPQASECGNQFHTYVTTTADWQLYLIPWTELVQWPCPNRLDGGIDIGDIRQIEIKFLQGTNYDLWLDNIEFYRPRIDGGN